MAPRKQCLPDIKGLMQYDLTGTVRVCIKLAQVQQDWMIALGLGIGYWIAPISKELSAADACWKRENFL